MDYIQKEDVILINEMTNQRHGGNFIPPTNFLNESPLDYLLEIIDSEMFGAPLYPESKDKAGLYMFNIISNHVFQDGNKRTGLESALLFLKLNGYQLNNQLKAVELDGITIPSSESIQEAKTAIGKPSSTNPNQIKNNELLTAFTLEVASSKVSLEACQQWFKENIE